MYEHIVDTHLNDGLSTTWLSRWWGSLMGLVDTAPRHRSGVCRCCAARRWGSSAGVDAVGILQHVASPVWGLSASLLSSCPHLLWKTREQCRKAACAAGVEEAGTSLKCNRNPPPACPCTRGRWRNGNDAVLWQGHTSELEALVFNGRGPVQLSALF